jgi:hypothetical protein
MVIPNSATKLPAVSSSGLLWMSFTLLITTVQMLAPMRRRMVPATENKVDIRKVLLFLRMPLRGTRSGIAVDCSARMTHVTRASAAQIVPRRIIQYAALVDLPV